MALIEMRWPDGFVCPRCGRVRHSWSPARRLFQCSDCRLQTSAKAGTIFHKSKTPLTKWFLAMHLISKRSINRFYTRPSFPERLIALAVLWGGYGWSGIDGEAADLAEAC